MNKISISEENLCNQCPSSIRGKCCYVFFWIIDNDQVHRTVPLSKHPCKYLNTKTGRCKIYKKRHEINPNCLTIKEMILCGTVPKECLYVKDNQEYQKRKGTALLHLPSNLSEDMKKQYEEVNNAPHSEVKSYETLRSFICPECESPNLKEIWEDKFSIIFCSYQCENCGYKWNNFNKQIQHSFKKIKAVN